GRPAQPRALPRAGRHRDQPDGLARRRQDRGARSDRPRARPRLHAGRARRRHRRRIDYHRHGVSSRRRHGASRAAPPALAHARLPVLRERRQPRVPGGLRPRAGRERRRAVGHRRRRQAAQVPDDVPQGGPRAADEGGSAAGARDRRRPDRREPRARDAAAGDDQGVVEDRRGHRSMGEVAARRRQTARRGLRYRRGARGMNATLALVAAAVSVGSLHTLAPDHWLPFAALARAERWSRPRTAGITALCGLGHVTASVALGFLALVFGLELLQTFGHRLESVSGLLLIGFGVAYGGWGLHRTLAARAHDRAHAHGHAHVHLIAHQSGEGHAHRRLTAWSLFLLFSADPCVAVIPLLFAAAPLGWTSTLAIVAAYELATIGTMVVLVIPTREAAGRLAGAWADRWGDALAGGVVAMVGLAVTILGI